MLTELEVLNALPSHGFVRAYVDYAVSCTDANAAYHLGCALTALTQAVPLDYQVPWPSPLWGNLFTLIVGGSSKSRKTASINMVRSIIADAIPGSIGEIPGSQEGLYESIRTQQRQLVVYGEFGEFLAKAEDGYLMSLKTAYTNLWDGIPIGRALAKAKRGQIDNPRLSLICGVATDLLERHTEQADWTGGFIARFLTFYAEPEREYSTPPLRDTAARNQIVHHLRDLAKINQKSGECLWLDDAGKKMWEDWYAGMGPMRTSANTRVAAACSRATAHAAKVALLLAWDIGAARTGQPWYVGLPELESALRIANLHLYSVLELGERVTGTKDMRDRATVLRAIGTSPTPSGYILKKSELLKRRCDEILMTLVEERTIVREVINSEVCYRQTPHLHAALAQVAINGSLISPYGATAAEIDSNTNLLALRPTRVQRQLAPMTPNHIPDDSEIDWATYNP